MTKGRSVIGNLRGQAMQTNIKLPKSKARSLRTSFVYFTSGQFFFCQFVDRKVLGVITTYPLLTGDTNQDFFLVKSIELSSKLHFTNGGNVMTISVLAIHFLLCPWQQGIPWQFLKQNSKFFFQISSQIYYLLSQTYGGRTYLEGACLDLSSKLPLMGIMLPISKVFTTLFLLFSLSVGIGDTQAGLKTNQ